jgi:thymidylate kinase
MAENSNDILIIDGERDISEIHKDIISEINKVMGSI